MSSSLFGLIEQSTSPALSAVRPGDAIERCQREQDEIRNRPDVVAGIAPAWLVTMGIEDWEREKEFLLVGRSQLDGSLKSTEAKP